MQHTVSYKNVTETGGTEVERDRGRVAKEGRIFLQEIRIKTSFFSFLFLLRHVSNHCKTRSTTLFTIKKNLLQSVVNGTVAAPGKLLEMQILSPYPRSLTQNQLFN